MDKGQGQRTDTPPLPPSLGGCGPELNAAFADWLVYKKERRQAYKPTGLKTLVSQVEAAAKEYGEDAVAALIRECMASNWQGIIFDRLRNGRAKSAAKSDKPFEYDPGDLTGDLSTLL